MGLLIGGSNAVVGAIADGNINKHIVYVLFSDSTRTLFFEATTIEANQIVFNSTAREVVEAASTATNQHRIEQESKREQKCHLRI